MGMAAFRNMHRILADLCGGEDKVRLMTGLNARETAIELVRATNEGLSADEAFALWEENGRIPLGAELNAIQAAKAAAAQPEAQEFQAAAPVQPDAGAAPAGLEGGEEAVSTGPLTPPDSSADSSAAPIRRRRVAKPVDPAPETIQTESAPAPEAADATPPAEG